MTKLSSVSKHTADKINLILSGKAGPEILSDKEVRGCEIYNRMEKRAEFWNDILDDVESAGYEGVSDSLKEWVNHLGIDMKVQIHKYEKPAKEDLSVSSIYTGKRKQLRELFSATLNFHYSISRIYEKFAAYEDIPHYLNSFLGYAQFEKLSVFLDYEEDKSEDTFDDYDIIYPYSVRCDNKLDRWLFIFDDLVYHALGGNECMRTFILHKRIDSHRYAESFKHLAEAIRSGLDSISISRGKLIAFCTHKAKYDPSDYFHCETGPAVKFPNGVEEFYLDGILVPRNAIIHGEVITVQDILNEENGWVKSRLLERYGIERFVNQSDCDVIDEKAEKAGVSQLLRLDLGHNEFAYCAKLICPSTKKEYVLRVPPSQTLKEAVGWTFGIPSHLYDPRKET